MVQMYFETVTLFESCIALNQLPEYGLAHIRFKLVAAKQTNANQFILYVLSIADSDTHQISTWHIINYVVCQWCNAVL